MRGHSVCAFLVLNMVFDVCAAAALSRASFSICSGESAAGGSIVLKPRVEPLKPNTPYELTNRGERESRLETRGEE